MVAHAMQTALTHHRAGRLEEAEAIYRQVLRADARNSEALHFLGLIAHQAGNHAAALELIDRALAIKPGYAEALNNRGTALCKLERYEEGLASYERALAVKPDFLQALNNRGNTLQDLNRHAEALECYGRALVLKPDYVDALNNRGKALQELKRHSEALEHFERALAIRPDYAKALNNRGVTLHALERYEEGLASYNRALTIEPGFAEALNNQGNALQELDRHAEALASYERALALKPDYYQALNNRGRALQELNRHAEALESYERALALKPDYGHALNNLGYTLQELNRHAEALENYERALTLNPDYAEAHYNRGLCLLLTGDFERGWLDYEWRWKCEGFQPTRRDMSQPLWLGAKNLEGKTILLHAEQGLGDSIQFSRYALLAAEKGARVILEVQPALKSLFSGLAGTDRVLAQGEVLPAFDFHCPLMSLPLAFNTRFGTIPAKVPYLTAKPDLAKKWADRLGGVSGPRVGVAWSGNRKYRKDRHRSIPLRSLIALSQCGATLVGLQKDVRPDDAAVLAESTQIVNFGEELDDFSDVAALISQLDLVVSVDTVFAHLAGALGKPVWVLQQFAPDWRWLLDRADSPWYPTARIFRQPRPGDWTSVIEEVENHLAAIARSPV